MLRRLALFAPMFIAACATVPDLGRAPEPRKATALATVDTLAGSAADWPSDRWWTGLGDPQLNDLIDKGLAASPDVALATARVRSAEAVAQQAGAAHGPSLAVDGTVGGVKLSENNGVPPAFVPDGIQDSGRLTAVLRFDLDVWGRNRAALAAARGEAVAAQVDGAQARLLLTTAIAAAYADLADLHAQRDAAVDALTLRSNTASLTAQRVQVGSETKGGQALAEARVPQARADVLALDESLAVTRNRLAALIGAGPDRGRAITRPSLRKAAVGIPSTAGIDLIGRRPDIVAARLRAEAAAARIKVARADFYPDVSLGALVGLQSLGLGNLIALGSTYGNSGLAVSLPMFDAGRIQGRYRGARADYDAAVARYDSILVTALREVADAAASRSAADGRLELLRQALTSASDAARIAQLRYRGGLSNQLPVLAADDNLVTVTRAVAQAENRRIAVDIALIRALGGGYRSAQSLAGTN